VKTTALRYGLLAYLLASLPALGHEPKLEHRFADVNGVRLHFVSAGAGKLIVFLHGFPHFWYQWHPQLAEFSKDYHVVAPDMRGYNLSSKPPAVEQYQLEYLVEDVRALAAHLGHTKFVLVGHDWGGFVAWAFALAHPRVLDKLVILNAPHPVLFARELTENPAQQAASQYIRSYRSPGAAAMLSANNYERLVTSVLADGLQAGWLSEADRQAYLEAWSQPGALTGALNYYRAAPVMPPPAHHAPIEVPTLLIWGLKDPYLLAGNLSGIGKLVPQVTVKLLPDASHWVNREKPMEVNTLIREFVQTKE
jgi:pimeloyl-ACP methyl ester carboxylesterase